MYLTLILLGLFILFVMLTDLGPQHSRKKFWVTLFRIREIMDYIFSIIFLCLVVGAVLVSLVFGIWNWIHGGGTSSLVTGAVFTVILCICYFCIKSTRDSVKRGEACECCGDCSKCRIQCRTNEKYYGLTHGRNETIGNKSK